MPHCPRSHGMRVTPTSLSWLGRWRRGFTPGDIGATASAVQTGNRGELNRCANCRPKKPRSRKAGRGSSRLEISGVLPIGVQAKILRAAPYQRAWGGGVPRQPAEAGLARFFRVGWTAQLGRTPAGERAGARQPGADTIPASKKKSPAAGNGRERLRRVPRRRSDRHTRLLTAGTRGGPEKPISRRPEPGPVPARCRTDN
jgi:hypothetical protein